MITVHKFPIKGTSSIGIHMPIGAQILDVQVQNGTPCIWAQVDTNQRNELRMFQIVPTGGEVPPQSHHIRTFQMPPFVWHLYGLIP